MDQHKYSICSFSCNIFYKDGRVDSIPSKEAFYSYLDTKQCLSVGVIYLYHFWYNSEPNKNQRNKISGYKSFPMLDAMLTLAIAGSRKARRGHLRHHLAARGLEIAAVRRDILSHKRGDMGEVCVKNDVSVGAKPSDDAVNVDRVPDEHGRKGG
jgi:hypothetical protein